MAHTGLLGMVLGGVARPVRLRRIADIEAASAFPPDAVLRLGALALFIEDDAERLRARLRLSNDETARLRAMAGRPLPAPSIAERERKATLYQLGARTFCDRTLLAWADSGADAKDSAWRELLNFPERWTPPKFPIAAARLMERGVEKGPRLGAALTRIENDWSAAGFPEDAASLERLIEDAIKRG
jgi:poly(A) polymerase